MSQNVDDPASSDNEGEATAGSNSVQGPQSLDTEQLMRTTPTIKPELIQLAVSLVIGLSIIAVLYGNPQLLGTVEATNIALILVQIVLAILIIRIAVQIIIIRNTVYTITDRHIRREYDLLGRNESREVPYKQIRSVGYSQGIIENLLNIGSISINQGLGDLELTSIPDSDEAHDIIQRQVKKSSQL
jgi:uncharacterized membrane protein YdbT with pleckstrin-like domain